MKKIVVLMAVLATLTATAQPLDPVAKDNLTTLVAASAMTAYAAEYCGLAQLRRAHIENKTQEILAIANTQWTQQEVSEMYEQARMTAKVRTAAVSHDRNCEPAAVGDLDEKFAKFADEVLTSFAPSTAN